MGDQQPLNNSIGNNNTNPQAGITFAKKYNPYLDQQQQQQQQQGISGSGVTASNLIKSRDKQDNINTNFNKSSNYPRNQRAYRVEEVQQESNSYKDNKLKDKQRQR